MVLWQKETTSADALFINLFADKSQINGIVEMDRRLQSSDWKKNILGVDYEPGKNNQTSDYFRQDGNFEFNGHNWIGAMEMYNMSLYFAVPGTNNVSFAYANRAACFFYMKKYDECLRDIELAMHANYPNMPKLDERKAKCERMMKENAQKATFEPKLSFSPNEKFPCMANVLEIQQNEEFGRHVIANCDIDIGKTVLVEQSFVSIGSGFDRVKCYECLHEAKNFIACSKCTDAMFCSEKCQTQSSVHQKFCGAAIHRMPKLVKFVAKSILIALNAFPNVNEMMDFVEKTLIERGEKMSLEANDLQSKYAFFLSLKPAKRERFRIELIYNTYFGLMDIPLIKSMFNSEKSQRFLMHLIGEHLCIISNNSSEGSTRVNPDYVMASLCNVWSLFNHACAPNLFSSSTGNTEVCITMRPIKKGEQVFVKYLCGDRETAQRQAILSQRWNFHCKCDKCEPHCLPTDRLTMKSDPNLQYLETFIFNMSCSNTIALPFDSLKDKCVEFLRRYGHLPWSEEMDIVLNVYTKCLLEDFSLS